MLDFLFPRLTRPAHEGEALFQALVSEARQAHWYVDGGIPDTIDGRFAVLATVIALATVRLERGSVAARDASVRLTERFIAAMDAEHRELGVSDPTLGRKVRKLVSSLARRVGFFREAVEVARPWRDVVAESLFQDEAAAAALAHDEQAARELWRRLERSADAALIDGRLE